MKPLTWELKSAYSYYTGFLILPTQVSKLEVLLHSSSNFLPFFFLLPKFRLIIYFISRIPPVLNFFTTAFEIGKTLEISHSTGNLSVQNLFGLILWQLCIPALFFADWLFLSRGFSHYFVQTTNLVDLIWRKCEQSVDPRTLKEIRQSNSWKVRLFMFHTFLIDLMTIFNFVTGSWGHPEEDPTLIFLFFPWTQSSTGKFLYWIVQNENALLSIMSWAALISFPGVLALHLECILKGLNEAVNNGRLEKYSFEEIMKDYNNLEHAIKELNRNSFSTCLLLFYLECGTEQTSSSFCIFQLIKSGASWDEWQYFFLDTLVCFKKNFLLSKLCEMFFFLALLFINILFDVFF